jgi:UDP-3-O-[3-hydroxymyristoyl] glucosamine N-acyltransferase LpxD
MENPELPARNVSETEHIRFAEQVSTSEIAELARRIQGAGKIEVRTGQQKLSQVVGVSDGRFPASDTLCFVDKAVRQTTIDQLQRNLIVTNPALATTLQGCSILVAPDARALFIDLLEQLEVAPGFSCFTTLANARPGIDPTAEVHPMAVIEEGVSVGAGARIAAGCVIKRGTVIGCDVTIRENTVIGGHGIALYKAQDGRLLRFPDLAGVLIGDRVEIGTSCVLPRGVLTSTLVGRDSIIGNLCNVGHGVRLGRRVWISVGASIGGNVSIGEGSTFGLGVAVRDNVQIGNNCSIGMGSVVMRDLPDGGSVLGNPARRLPRVAAGPER